MSKNAELTKYGSLETRGNGGLKSEPQEIEWEYAECDAETGVRIGKKKPEKIVGFDNNSRLFPARYIALAGLVFFLAGMVFGTLLP